MNSGHLLLSWLLTLGLFLFSAKKSNNTLPRWFFFIFSNQHWERCSEDSVILHRLPLLPWDYRGTRSDLYLPPETVEISHICFCPSDLPLPSLISRLLAVWVRQCCGTLGPDPLFILMWQLHTEMNVWIFHFSYFTFTWIKLYVETCLQVTFYVFTMWQGCTFEGLFFKWNWCFLFFLNSWY